MSALRCGATTGEWDCFSLRLGLAEDMLPVVSAAGAAIAPDSKLRALGKTPSRYNKLRQVTGIARWTEHRATIEQVERWRGEPDYGIALQTRFVRAIDVDVLDPTLAAEIAQVVAGALGPLPCRARANSPKFLLAFALEGAHTKRVIKTQHGAIEFLANGQQFIAAGEHPSGARYDWVGGLPAAVPVHTLAAFDGLWTLLQARFGVEPAREHRDGIPKSHALALASEADPVAQALGERGLVLSREQDGRMHIVCPFAAEHTGAVTESATTYFPAHTGGFARGHFRCLHAHCAQRTDQDYLDALDLDTRIADFDEVVVAAPAANPFAFQHIAQFSSGAPASWFIKGVLPRAALGVIFGESGSGKSFFALDMAASIARGLPWRERRTRKARVAYIVAEGAGGFRQRAHAYSGHHGIGLADLDIAILGDAPNFMRVVDVQRVIDGVTAYGGVEIIVVDTFAQVLPGANENSAEDVGLALSHCRTLHKLTGAMVLLIHHSGKDATKGARGWSGLRAAADFEMEITRADDRRAATVTKLKDGEDGAAFGFTLRTVAMGADSDGDELTSCVVEQGGDQDRGARKRRLGSVEKAVIRKLNELTAMLPDDERVSTTELISHVARDMIHDVEGKQDKRRYHALRALDNLVSDAVLSVDGPWIVRSK